MQHVKSAFFIYFVLLFHTIAIAQSSDWQFVVMPPKADSTNTYFLHKNLWVLENGNMLIVNNDGKRYIYRDNKWELIDLIPYPYYGCFVEKNVIYFTDQNILYTSIDFGKTFTKKTLPAFIYSIEDGIITIMNKFPTTYSISSDGGDTWQLQSAPIAENLSHAETFGVLKGKNGNLCFMEKEYYPSLTKTYYIPNEINLNTNEIIIRDKDVNRINSWAYANEGENLYVVTWAEDKYPFFKTLRRYGTTSTVSLPFPKGLPIYSISADGAGGIYCIGYKTLLYSSDEGKNWIDIFPDDTYNIYSLLAAFGQDKNLYFITNDNGIYKYKSQLAQPRKMKITFYEDLNSNCQKDEDESTKENFIKIQYNGNRWLTNNGEISFNIFSDTIVDLKLLYDKELYAVCDSTLSIHKSWIDTTDVAIPFKKIKPCASPYLSLYFGNLFSPRFDNIVQLIVRNDGTEDIVDKTVDLKFPALLNLEEATTDIQSQTTSSAVIKINNIKPQETRIINLYFGFDNKGFYPYDDTLCIEALSTSESFCTKTNFTEICTPIAEQNIKYKHIALIYDENSNCIVDEGEKIIKENLTTATLKSEFEFYTLSFKEKGEVFSNLNYNGGIKNNYALNVMSAPGYKVCQNIFNFDSQNDLQKSIFILISPTDGNEIKEINLLPNYGNGRVKVVFKNIEIGNGLHYEIQNVQGKSVKSGIVQANDSLDFSDLPRGLYFFKIVIDGKNYVDKYMRL